MTIDTRSVIEEDDRYILPLAGRTVSRCFFDFRFGLCFYVDGPSIEIAIGGKIRLSIQGREVVLDPQPGAGSDPPSLAPLLTLFGKCVVWAHAFKNGALKILFEGDLTLEVDPGGMYEPWELSSNDGLKLVSLPGGSLDYCKPFVKMATPSQIQ